MSEQEAPPIQESQPHKREEAMVPAQSLDASKAVAEALSAGRQPTEEERAALAQAIQAELAARGVVLTPKEMEAWQRSTNGLFKKASREPGTIDKKTQNGFSEFLQWMPEYSATVQDVSDKYGFSTRAGPKLRLWQGVMGALALVEGAGPTYLAWRWVNRKFWQDKQEYNQQTKLPRALTIKDDRHIEVRTQWNPQLTRSAKRHAAEIAEFLDQDPGKNPLLKSAYAERKLLERLPLLISLSAIPLGQLRGKAVEQFQEQMGFVQKSLNERIANTYLMRDFEFMHDTPAMELINRMERGRWAVTTLIAEHHINIVPRLLATGAAIASRIREDPLVFGLSLARIPFLLSAAKEHIDESIKWGREEGKKRAEVERMIGSILVSAEVVKTDDVEEAARQLRDALDARDDVLRGKERRLTESEKGHVRVTKTFDVAAPAMSALWRIVNNGGVHRTSETVAQPSRGMLGRIASFPRNFVTDRYGDLNDARANIADVPNRFRTVPSMSRADWIIKGSDVLESVLSSSRTQDILKANIGALVGLYTGTLRTAVMEARKFEDFLGSYEALDRPDGPKEQARVPIESLPNLDISFRNLSYKNILHDVSLDIPQGSFVTIKGEKGSGKTTLLRHLMGLYGKESGGVRYGGVPIDGIKQYGDQALQRVIGYANQEPHILPHMTIRENLLLWSRRKISDERLRDTLNELGMGKFSDKLDEKHAHFSGGEKRLIGIARALLKDPKVLFLDEPTSNLDVQTGKQVMEIIQELRRKRPGMTVVAITHDPVFETIAERVIDFSELNMKPTEQVFVGSADASSPQVKEGV